MVSDDLSVVCENLEDIVEQSKGTRQMVGSRTGRTYEVTPSAARLTESLRDIGYDFASAVADLVDNSIAARATQVQVMVEFDGVDSRVFIVDDGLGMSENALVEALRFGTRRTYADGELGRYGLGLKTASLSQCRSVTVVTRRSIPGGRVFERELNLDLIAEWDQWLVVAPHRTEELERALRMLEDGTGTVIMWQGLDRVLPEKRPDGGWARRRLEGYARKTAEHLGIVFHRYIEGLPNGRRITVTVNGEKVEPWNPFAPSEGNGTVLPAQRFDLTVGEATGSVRLQRFVLPARTRFSSAAEFERLSGPLNWNRQQGLYIYRADRLVQWGGWAGLRGIDEHTKLARAALDFDTSLDPAFNINVSKMRVSIPPQLRQMLEAPVHELCLSANTAYRRASGRGNTPIHADPRRRAGGSTEPMPLAGLALRSAAMQTGQSAALELILEVLRRDAPDVVSTLGFDR